MNTSCILGAFSAKAIMKRQQRKSKTSSLRWGGPREVECEAGALDPLIISKFQQFLPLSWCGGTGSSAYEIWLLKFWRVLQAIPTHISSLKLVLVESIYTMEIGKCSQSGFSFVIPGLRASVLCLPVPAVNLFSTLAPSSGPSYRSMRLWVHHVSM